MKLFSYLFVGFFCLTACSTPSKPDSIQFKAKAKVNERVDKRLLEEQKPEVQPSEPLATAELIKKVDGCFDAILAQDDHRVRMCFTKEAAAIHADASEVRRGGSEIVSSMYQPAWSAFPDLRGGSELKMIKGTDVVVMSWARGTHSGDLSGLEPTEEIIGVHSLKVLKLANDGRIRMEASYSDSLRVLGQLGMSALPFRPAFDKAPVEGAWIQSTNPETEKVNTRLAESFTQALSTHELTALDPLFHKDVVLRDYALVEDINGPVAIRAEMEELLGAFSDLKVENRMRLAVGDYVVQLLAFVGTNDGPWSRFGWEENKRKLTVNIGFVFQVSESKISKVWRYWDAKLALQRIGKKFEKK